MPGVSPVPESDAVAGLPLNPPPTLSIPARFPVVEGMKITWIEQLPPAASVVVQVDDETAKSPVTTGACNVPETPPLLVAVKEVEAELDPTPTPPKFAEEGESTRFAGTRPVPPSVAETDPPETFPGTVNRPARLPACAGVKTSWMRQVAPPASELPQVFVLIW